jgi:hypothetical protein
MQKMWQSVRRVSATCCCERAKNVSGQPLTPKSRTFSLHRTAEY